LEILFHLIPTFAGIIAYFSLEIIFKIHPIFLNLKLFGFVTKVNKNLPFHFNLKLQNILFSYFGFETLILTSRLKMVMCVRYCFAVLKKEFIFKQMSWF
jgi:hypothetical protein